MPDLRVVKVKDYIARPKSSGYRSIYVITEFSPVDGIGSAEGLAVRLEIQVCSAAMNYWAMLNHQLGYKNAKKGSRRFKKVEKEW